jgi:hypothetical protein
MHVYIQIHTHIYEGNILYARLELESRQQEALAKASALAEQVTREEERVNSEQQHVDALQVLALLALLAQKYSVSLLY